MYRKILSTFIIFIFVFLWNININFADYNWPAVFKIYSYSYKEDINSFFPQWYWSAVYIWNNIIITNAHVVKSYKWNYEGFYSVCETIDFKQNPKCFTDAKLLYVDETKDLAYLKLSKSPQTTKKVEFSDKQLNIWDKIYTYGYPAIWWKTITYTAWKISGYDSWKYKIDASIDSWNSWGWVFDDDWKLVWITSSIISENNTIWYVIPVSDIKNFISKKWNISTFPEISLEKFKNYLNDFYKKYYSDNIDTDFIELKNISKYWFKIVSIINHNNKESYFLKNNNTIIELYSVVKNIKGLASTNETRNVLNKVFKNNSVIQYIYINWKKIIYDYDYDKDNWNIELFFKDSIYWYRVKIYWNIKDKQTLKKALILIFKNWKFKNNLDYEKNIKLNWLTINQNVNFGFYKSFNKDYLQDEVYWEKFLTKKILETIYIQSFNLLNEENITFKDFYKTFISEKYDYNNLYKWAFYSKKLGWYFYSIIRQDTYTKITFLKFLKYNWEKVAYRIEFIFLWGKEWKSFTIWNWIKIVSNNFQKEISSNIFNFLENINYKWTEFFSEKDFYSIKWQRDWLDNMDTVKGKLYSNSQSFKNLKLQLSKKEAFDFLKKIIWKDLNISNISNNNININESINQNFVNIYKENLKNTKYYKYIPKINSLIEKLPKEKLLKVLWRINKINLVKIQKIKL